ncbi:MAG: hypothetical protein HW386_2491 [Gammaproteobacteria bacterium]|nr:hypothetical protein [Gammaproteobacteria bacterium]
MRVVFNPVCPHPNPLWLDFRVRPPLGELLSTKFARLWLPASLYRLRPWSRPGEFVPEGEGEKLCAQFGGKNSSNTVWRSL